MLWIQWFDYQQQQIIQRMNPIIFKQILFEQLFFVKTLKKKKKRTKHKKLKSNPPYLKKSSVNFQNSTALVLIRFLPYSSWD